MTQVSPRFLPPKVSGEIFDIFLSALTSLSSSKQTINFIESLLSPTEQIMIGKRLAIAYMLQKGYSQRAIQDTLKVSLTTVNKINASLKIKGNGYTQVIERMLTIQKVKDFFAKLEEKIDHLLPPKGVNWSEHYKSSHLRRQTAKKSF